MTTKFAEQPGPETAQIPASFETAPLATNRQIVIYAKIETVLEADSVGEFPKQEAMLAFSSSAQTIFVQRKLNTETDFLFQMVQEHQQQQTNPNTQDAQEFRHVL